MDTNFVTEAFKQWQKRNSTTRTWEQLTQAERSEIMQAAQELKLNANGRAE